MDPQDNREKSDGAADSPDRNADEKFLAWARENGYSVPKSDDADETLPMTSPPTVPASLPSERSMPLGAGDQGAGGLLSCQGCGHTVHARANACPGCGLPPGVSASQSTTMQASQPSPSTHVAAGPTAAVVNSVPPSPATNRAGKGESTFGGLVGIALTVAGVVMVIACSGVGSRSSSRSGNRSFALKANSVGNTTSSSGTQVLIDLMKKRLEKTAEGFLPAARIASQLSVNNNRAAEGYLDKVIRPHVKRDSTLTDQSFAKDGLCQVCFDYDDTNIAGQICVTARDDGYEHVGVNLWAK